MNNSGLHWSLLFFLFLYLLLHFTFFSSIHSLSLVFLWLYRGLPHVFDYFPLLCLLISPSVSLGPLRSTRPWDPLNDLIQFEKDGCIQTKVRHRTPMVRSGSLISLSNQGPRRDNCKCQVGCPDRKPPLKKKKKKQLAASTTFHAAPGAPSSLSLLLCVPPSPLSPLLLFCLFFSVCFCFFFSYPGTCCSLCMGMSKCMLM